jgi:hypothetical protein
VRRPYPDWWSDCDQGSEQRLAGCSQPFVERCSRGVIDAEPCPRELGREILPQGNAAPGHASEMEAVPCRRMEAVTSRRFPAPQQWLEKFPRSVAGRAGAEQMRCKPERPAIVGPELITSVLAPDRRLVCPAAGSPT